MIEAADAVAWTFERYERVRDRLPAAAFPRTTIAADGLLDLTDRFDAFLLDSFGVLNVGETAIPGAVDCIAQLNRAGKHVIVLTNAASGVVDSLPAKYRALGFEFPRDRIVSSRELLERHLARAPRDMRWAVMAPPASRIETLGVPAVRIDLENPDWKDADGFVLLSTGGWTPAITAELRSVQADRKRPVLVGNPDLAAPREAGLSLEPGAIAHDLIDKMPDLACSFFGKPFANAFVAACERLPAAVPRNRIAMVGDTLHTDILGGAAAGLSTVLVTDWGVLAGRDSAEAIARSGIVPTYTMASIAGATLGN